MEFLSENKEKVIVVKLLHAGEAKTVEVTPAERPQDQFKFFPPETFNFELPEVPEHYVHRIGRTGRAGNEGLAVSLVAPDERPLLKAVERLLGYALPVLRAEGYTPAPPRNDERPQRRHEHRQQPARAQESRGNRGHKPRNNGGRRHDGRQQQRGARSSGRGQGGGRY